LQLHPSPATRIGLAGRRRLLPETPRPTLARLFRERPTYQTAESDCAGAYFAAGSALRVVIERPCMSEKSPPRATNDNNQHGDEHGHETGLRAAELDFPGQFVLWGMRAWLAARRQNERRGNENGGFNAYRSLAGEGFLKAGVPQAMELIDDVFQALANAAIRQIDLRCPHCAFVSPDEALLLGAVAASQRKQHAVSWSALTALLPPAAARGALPSLISLAILLQSADLVLSPLDAEKCGAPDLRIAMAQASATAPIH